MLPEDTETMETTEAVESPKVVETTRITREQAVENTKNNLEKIFGDKPIPEESKQEESIPAKPDEQTEESIPEPTDKESAEETVEPEGEKPAESKEEPKAGKEPHFTQAELRAATQSQWTKDELESLYEKDPLLAKKTVNKLLDTVNAASKKFSEFGRKTVPAVTAPANTVVHTPKVEFKKVDLSAIEKEYEGDPIIDVLKTVMTNNEALAAKLEAQSATIVTHTSSEADRAIQQANAEQDAAVAQEIDLFFASPDAIATKDFYGIVPKNQKNWDNLTGSQIKNRYTVIQEANLILKGALSQGMDMSLQEAFERANLLVTAPIREQTIRNQIKSQAIKRSKSITLEPSAATVAVKVSPVTRAQAVANTAAVLAKLNK